MVGGVASSLFLAAGAQKAGLALRAPYTVKQFAQHRLLRILFDRVWGGLTVCATV